MVKQMYETKAQELLDMITALGWRSVKLDVMMLRELEMAVKGQASAFQEPLRQ